MAGSRVLSSAELQQRRGAGGVWKRAAINCPHCGSRAPVRSSREVSPTYRHLNLQCANIECGHTFAAALEILYTIAPSATPNPEVNLRMAPPRQRPIPANDDGAWGARAPGVAPTRAANDDDVGEAVNTGT